MQVQKKRPEEVRLYDFDFAAQQEIVNGDSITDVLSITVSTAVGTSVTALAVGSPTITGDKVFFPVEAGTEGVVYRLDIQVKLDRIAYGSQHVILKESGLLEVFNEDNP